jgi:hypothetical protein
MAMRLSMKEIAEFVLQLFMVPSIDRLRKALDHLESEARAHEWESHSSDLDAPTELHAY